MVVPALVSAVSHYLQVSGNNYWLTRFVILRLLGFVYFFAFLSLAKQVIPLIGKKGLLPAEHYLYYVSEHYPTKLRAFFAHPTLFWFTMSDRFLLLFSWVGLILSFFVMIGFANVPLLFLLWLLYLSFVNIGQLWYSYGWEIQLLETGFLAIFFVPLFNPLPFAPTVPAIPVIWLFWWLTFRIYLGAGLIKIRGDACWRNLTCMYHHYETQPIPGPLSRYFHFLPKWIHKLSVVFNHLVELVVPFFLFWPRILQIIAGLLMTLFQLILILSGNLSFLNWLTIIPALAVFDDQFLAKILPRSLILSAEQAQAHAVSVSIIPSLLLLVVAVYLSIPVIRNLFSSRQIMNTSFNRFYLVNTYGAFGTVGRERYELIIEGTEEDILSADTSWKEYGFKGKPGNIDKIPSLIAPYQSRLDWQIWFAAMEGPEDNPWLIHLLWKLLHNDADTLRLLNGNPFPGTPPHFVRISYYLYRFAPLGSKHVWERIFISQWLPPVEQEDLRGFIEANGWWMYQDTRS